MSNVDLDTALSLIPTISMLKSTCSIDLIDSLIPIPQSLANARNDSTLSLPLWFRGHWILGTYNKGTLDIWDSAPSGLVKDDVIAFAKTLATRLRQPLRVRGRLAARQPYGTRQCGIHTIVRALLTSLGISSLLPNVPIADWEALRNVLPQERGNVPNDFIASALVAVTRPECTVKATKDALIGHLPDTEVRSSLGTAQINHRFLVAQHTSKTAKPSQWSWGIATVVSHKRAVTSISWKSIISTADSATTMVLPSPSVHIFAVSPLRPAPVTWDVCTSDIAEPSFAHTLRIGPSSPDATPSPSRAREPSGPPVLPQQASLSQHPTAPPANQAQGQSTYTTASTPDAVAQPIGDTTGLLSEEILQAVARFPQAAPGTLKGRDLTQLQVVEARDAHVPALALRALAPATANNHRQLLRSLAFLPRDLHETSLDKAIIEWQCRQMKRRNWLYSTLHTKLASFAGALKLLPLYAKDQPSIHMSSSVVWAQASKAALQKQQLHAPQRATPAKWTDVTSIMLRENHSVSSLAVLTAWLTCGRMADVLRLRSTDIQLSSEYLTVTFRDTKTRNPYTVATALPPAPHVGHLLELIDNAAINRPLFSTSAPVVARALKAQHPSLTQHSLRRGALQTLAAAGIPMTALMHFSGHRTTVSLMAYLNDGASAPENPARAIQARILIGGGIEGDYTPLPPPSMDEIRRCFPSSITPERPPLHMKKVKHMDLDKLLDLPMQDDTRAYLKAALRWVRDPALFESALARGKPVRRSHKAPSFTDEEMSQMMDYKFSQRAATGKPHFPVFGFPVRQYKGGKEVLRAIWEPAINDAVEGFEAQPLHLPTRGQVLSDSTPGTNEPHLWCQLDGVSCFDQVPLDADVKSFFTMVWREVLYALTSLPMGFRRAVEVACAILWALLDFPRPACVRVNSYVDNVRFGGPVAPTAEAVITFVRRASSVGYQLDSHPTTIAEVLAISPPTDTFLGVLYDYTKQTRSLPPKTIAKLQAIGDAHKTLTHRQLACIVGITTWAGSILEFGWHRVWHLLRRYAACATAYNHNTRITLSDKEHSELSLLLQFCLANKEVPILAPPSPPVDLLIITDASKTGWGALAGRPASTPTTLAGLWSNMLGSSVVAEPEGAWQAIQATLRGRSQPPAHIRLLTDHQPLVFAQASGRARAWAYNALLSRLSTLPCHVSLGFVAGAANPADGPSRGLPTTAADIEAFMSVAANVAAPEPPHKPRFMT